MSQGKVTSAPSGVAQNVVVKKPFMLPMPVATTPKK